MEDSADDLDQLLDSALDDFTKLGLASSSRTSCGEAEEKNARDDTPSSSSILGLGLGMGLPLPRRVEKDNKRRQKTSPNVRPSHASEALEKLTQQTREAVMGLGTATMGNESGQNCDLNQERMVEEFVKEFEQLSGSQDMESIVETMMQQLLSKEILHDPMKEIAQKYPKWLEEHKVSINTEDYDRYSRQYQFILQLNDIYENDSNNFPKILELMQKMQDCGQPPNDIIHDLAPELDLANLGANQLTPESLLSSSPNCSVM